MKPTCQAIVWFVFLLSLVTTAQAGQSPPPKLLTGQAPYFIYQPQSISNVVEGGTASFTVIAGGSPPLTYQWLKDSTPISGATSTSIQFVNANRERDGGTYQVVVNNGFGSLTSTGAYLFIWPLIPAIIQQPQSTQVDEYGVVALSVWMVTDVFPVTYQWYKDGVALRDSGYIQGSADPELTLRSVRTTDGGEYTVTISNSYGTVSSAPALLTIKPWPPQFWSYPFQGVGVAKGSPLTVTIDARGDAPIVYQWFRIRANSGQITEPLLGANSATLELPNAQLEDSGDYWVTVTNPGGSVEGPRFPVVVEEPPAIIIPPPEKVAVLPAQWFSLKLQITGAGLNTRWFRDGNPVGTVWSPLTNNLLEATLDITGWDGLGDYFVVAANAAGAVTSSVCRVERKQPVAKRPPSPAPVDLSLGLVAHWAFDEPSGLDSIGHYNLNTADNFRPGRQGNALGAIPDGCAFHATSVEDEVPITRNPTFTIAFWILEGSTNSFPDVTYLYREGTSEAAGGFFGLGADPSRRATFRFPSEAAETHTESLICRRGAWRHVAFVQDNNGTRWLYIDGIEADTSLPIQSPDLWNPAYTRLADSGSFYRFSVVYSLDDVALWKRALSAEEILAVITDGVPGSGSNPQPSNPSFQSVQKKGAVLTLNWKSTQTGTYSFLKSPNVSGPWTAVTNLPASSNEARSFSDAVTEDQIVFYRIRLEPQ